jgi:hypothetical protein
MTGAPDRRLRLDLASLAQEIPEIAERLLLV